MNVRLKYPYKKIQLLLLISFKQITKNSKFLDRVGDIVALNRNLNEVLTVCRMAVSRLSTPVDEGDPLPLLTLDMFLDAFDMMRQDQKMEVMMGEENYFILLFQFRTLFKCILPIHSSHDPKRYLVTRAQSANCHEETH